MKNEIIKNGKVVSAQKLGSTIDTDKYNEMKNNNVTEYKTLLDSQRKQCLKTEDDRVF